MQIDDNKIVIGGEWEIVLPKGGRGGTIRHIHSRAALHSYFSGWILAKDRFFCWYCDKPVPEKVLKFIKLITL